MRDECLEMVSSALGRHLMASQGKDITERVSKWMRRLATDNPEEWRQKSYTTRLHEAAAEAATEMKEEFTRKRANIERDIAVMDNIHNFIDTQDYTKAGQRANSVARLLDFNTVKGGRESAASRIKSVHAEYEGNLTEAFQKIPGAFDLFKSKDGVSALWKEFYGEDSGNSTAKAAAKAWGEVAEAMRIRFNDGGGNVGKLENWGVPQHHSQYRVASAGLQKWVDYVFPRLDRSKYINGDGTRFTDEQLHDFLPHAFESIITSGHNKREPGQITGGGKIADRDTASRQIFFKDGQSGAEYHSQFGDMSIGDVMMSHMRSMSRNIGLIERLGTNPEATIRYFNDRARLDDLREFGTKAAKIESAHDFNNALYDAVAGRETVIDTRIANAFQTFRNFMTATKLPKVVITALSDEAGMWATATANKIPYAAAAMEEAKRIAPTEARRMAESQGLGFNNFGQEISNLLDTNFGSASKFTSKMASSVLKWSGAERMWSARRQGLGVVIMNKVGQLSRELDSISKLHEEDAGVLARKGVDEKVWQTWRNAKTENWGNNSTMLTPRAIYAIPDSALSHLGNPIQLRREAVSTLLSHIHEEAGMGAMDTGPTQRLAMTRGTQKGTWGGELVRCIGLFKSFTMSMMMKHWTRMASMPGTGKAKYAAALFVYGTALSATGNQIRNLLMGQNPDDMTQGKFWGQAMLRGGGLGFFGDFLSAELTQNDTSLTAALGGPLDTTIEDIAKLTHGAFMRQTQGQITDEKAKLIRLASQNIPFLNMWYAQAAMNHLIWNNLQEASNPGYLNRMTARAEGTYGKSYWWKPNQGVPNQGPDLAKAFGSKATGASFAGNQ